MRIFEILLTIFLFLSLIVTIFVKNRVLFFNKHDKLKLLMPGLFCRTCSGKYDNGRISFRHDSYVCVKRHSVAIRDLFRLHSFGMAFSDS